MRHDHRLKKDNLVTDALLPMPASHVQWESGTSPSAKETVSAQHDTRGEEGRELLLTQLPDKVALPWRSLQPQA